MGLFQHVEGDCAVIIEKGVYKQCDLFKRDGYLFAKLGSGFVRLMADGATTKASARIDTLMHEGPLYRDTLGRLACDPGVIGAKALPSNQQQKLLGIAGPN